MFHKAAPPTKRSRLLSILAAVAASAVCACLAIGTDAPSTRPASEPASELLKPVGQASAAAFDPTSQYELRDIEGWPVRVNRKLLHDEPGLAAQTLELLHFQFYQIAREVPAPALARIRTVTFWVELKDPLFPCMCYHPDRGWVAGHALNPEKTKCVELANAKTFLRWEHSQPWMVLHEYAHAYHHQFVPDGFDNAQILAAYRGAKEARLYDAILRNNGKTEKAYAMTNQMEYFAELSESYFGTNDFYPFIRAELKVHDPVGFEMMKSAWGLQ